MIIRSFGGKNALCNKFPPSFFKVKNPSDALIETTCFSLVYTFLIFPVFFDFIIFISPLNSASPAPFPNWKSAIAFTFCKSNCSFPFSGIFFVNCGNLSINFLLKLLTILLLSLSKEEGKTDCDTG